MKIDCLGGWLLGLLLWVGMLWGSIGLGQQPNILWINAEDMSPHLGCYGHPNANTPQLDQLALQGIVYQNAFATAPICSPSRSCLATGLYATSLGTQHLRCEVEIPERVVPLAKRLRELGYFCTNTGKSDYNFNPDGIWDAWNSELAPWRARRAGQPFFGFITIGETHEGRINIRERYDEATQGLATAERHDPAKVLVPPFYPDTPEIRKLFAGMHDLATVFDRKVGEIVSTLQEDGDWENTILFVFGDHGNGIPRYKRWLNDSGLRVPLIVYVPPKWQHLCDTNLRQQLSSDAKPDALALAAIDRMVSFVDFPATALSLAGEKVPPLLQGQPFLGKTIAPQREFVFGARSRADDMFEVSRSVFDGRYFYVRHFLPHYPYFQKSVIFDDRKASVRELRRLYEAGELDEQASKLWAARKPREELYDLHGDPHELNNLAEDSALAAVKDKLAKTLKSWMLETRDSGLLPEAEYQIRARANGCTPFDIAQDEELFELRPTLHAAWQVGDPAVELSDVIENFSHRESGVRFWAATFIQAREHWTSEEKSDVVDGLQRLLGDASPSVRVAASEAILRLELPSQELEDRALATLADVLQDERPWVALEAASAHARMGAKVCSNLAVIKQVRQSNFSEPGAPRPYKDFNYASFTGWALETALQQCGN